jgi:hypothetical protein
VAALTNKKSRINVTGTAGGFFTFPKLRRKPAKA